MTPKQALLSTHLRARVQTLEAGAKLPSIRWLMKHFDVSQQTVVSSLDRMAAEGLIERRHGSGIYVSPRAEKRTILFVRTNFPSANFELIETGLRRAAQARHWGLHVYRKEQVDRGIFVAPHLTPDIVILMSDLLESDLERLRCIYPGRTCFIVIGTAAGAPDADFVTTDDDRGLEMLIGHLARLNHRRIAFLNNEPLFPEVAARIETFRKLCGSHCTIEHSEVIDCHIAPWGDVAARPYDGMSRMLRERAALDFTALIACSFPGAIAAIRALEDEGYRVPEELAVVSLNEEAYADFLQPRPSTLWWDLPSIGEECLRIAERRLRREVARCIGTRIAPQLRIRESCGKPAAHGERKRARTRSTPASATSLALATASQA